MILAYRFHDDMHIVFFNKGEELEEYVKENDINVNHWKMEAEWKHKEGRMYKANKYPVKGRFN